MATLGNRRSTAEIIEKYHFSFQKKFGQNFLVDSSILDRIIESAQITKEDCVLFRSDRKSTRLNSSH